MLLEHYTPKSNLVTETTQVKGPRFPVVDVHAHFGELLLGAHFEDLYDTLTVVDALRSQGVRGIVNLDLGFGDMRKRMTKKLNPGGEFFINFGTVDVERFETPSFRDDVFRSIEDGVKNGMKGLKLWKNIGLKIKDSRGNFLRPDDARLNCIYEAASEYNIPILYHIADPVAFWAPVNGTNERYEELRNNPDWSYADPQFYTFHQLMKMQENVIGSNPDTTFIIAHFGSYSENLSQVGVWLDQYPNMYVDIAARISELGRQPYSSCAFMEKYSSRIFFGTDYSPLSGDLHMNYYRCLETKDEYFNPEGEQAKNGFGQGRWNIYGLGLSDHALEDIYYKNAERLFNFSIG